MNQPTHPSIAKSNSNARSVSRVAGTIAATGLVCLMTTGNAVAQVCEEAVLSGPAPSCPSDSYRVLSGTDDEISNVDMCNAKKTQSQASCVARGSMEPPPPAWIHCQPAAPGDSVCTAWPQGDLDFDWAVSARLEMVEAAQQIQPAMGGMMQAGGPVSSQLEILPGSDINLPRAGNGPIQRIQCREPVGTGLVSVTITTPDGIRDTVFAGVHCDEAVL